MARFFKDKDGKVKMTEPHTKPHPRPQARDAKGNPYYKPPAAAKVEAPAKADKPSKSGGEK